MNLTLTIPESTQPPITVEVGGTTELTSYVAQVAGLPDYPATFPPAIGSAANQAVAGNDPRLTNSRTPTAHKSTHATGGSDALTPADIGAMANTNAAVSAAIEDDPAATRSAANIVGINVKDPAYGAVGNGIADDTAAIQAALNAASVTTSLRVYLPAGTYKISSALVLSIPGTQVEGDGIYSTIIQQTTAGSHGFAWDGYNLPRPGGTGPQACNVSFLKVVGPGYPTSTGSGFYMRRDNGEFLTGISRLHNLFIEGFANGIYAGSFARLSIEDCRLLNNFISIRLSGVDTYRVTNVSCGTSTIDRGLGSIAVKLEGSNFGGTIQNGEYGDCDYFLHVSGGNYVTVQEPNVERCGDADGGSAVYIEGNATVRWAGGRVENGVGNSTRAVIRIKSTVAGGTPSLSIYGRSNFGAGVGGTNARTIEINGDNRNATQVTSTNGRYDVTHCNVGGGTADAGVMFTSPFPVHGASSGVASSSANRGNPSFIGGAQGQSDHAVIVAKKSTGTYTRRGIINDNLIQILNDTTTAVTNSGTGATTLYTYTVPSDTIIATKQSIRVRAFGKFAANTNNKHIQVNFGGAIAIFDSTALAINDNDWALDVLIVLTASGNFSALVNAQCDDALWVNRIQVTKTIARGSNQANVINIVGTGGATADIELLWAQTMWHKNDSEF
jgi:hypothetical protein